MTDSSREAVERLIQAAASADKSEDAMRFSQAANNAANAMILLHDIDNPVVD